MLVVEDVHTSYMKKKWYNPSKYSFINFSKKLIDDINSRFPGLKQFNFSLKKYVYSIQHFESITVFNINQKLCKKNQYIENNKISEIINEFSVSKFPVGSSAKINSGFIAIALAIATLCCSPPDNWLGKLLKR